MLKYCAANRKRRLSSLAYLGPNIYDVKISGFTRSSIYIYDINRLRVKQVKIYSSVAKFNSKYYVQSVISEVLCRCFICAKFITFQFFSFTKFFVWLQYKLVELCIYFCTRVLIYYNAWSKQRKNYVLIMRFRGRPPLFYYSKSLSQLFPPRSRLHKIFTTPVTFNKKRNLEWAIIFSVVTKNSLNVNNALHTGIPTRCS
jgi:hypothetical protein